VLSPLCMGSCTLAGGQEPDENVAIAPDSGDRGSQIHPDLVALVIGPLMPWHRLSEMRVNPQGGSHG